MKEDAIILHYVGDLKPWNYAKCYGTNGCSTINCYLRTISYFSFDKGRKRGILKTFIRLLSLFIPIKNGGVYLEIIASKKYTYE